MRPLEAFANVEKLLRGAPAEAVRSELDAWLDRTGDRTPPLERAALAYARGALALREGQLTEACRAFEQAAEAYHAANEQEASALSTCEHWLARIRKGPPSVYDEADSALEQIATGAASRIVRVVATHYRGTALRYAGRVEQTQKALLDAVAESDGLLAERAQILNSLGTFYVVVGAYGAARALLEHAADLHRRLGDAVGEAISCGQLGSAALALGEPEAARRHLQRQEWLASRVGDNFGRARALVLLADLANDLDRPDDAVTLAEQAKVVASSVEPPLAMWIAYATRSIGRAKLGLGDPTAAAALDDARARFRAVGNQLGEALIAWDVARARGGSGWAEATWALASLGLGQRVGQLLSDCRRQLAAGAQGGGADLARVDWALASCAQVFPHLGSSHEVDLVYNQPGTLSRITSRRLEGQRNLGRLAALALGNPGLTIAVLVSGTIADGWQAVPPKSAESVLVGRMPGCAVWAWRSDTPAGTLARDLAAAAAAAADLRGAVGLRPEARIRALPMAGEVGADIADARIEHLLQAALAAPPRAVARDASVSWTDEAERILRAAGLSPAG
jgi:tetratricopeptide (TPR) repeat protein